MALTEGILFKGQFLDKETFKDQIKPYLNNLEYFSNFKGALETFEQKASSYSPGELAKEWEMIQQNYLYTSPTNVIVSTTLPSTSTQIPQDTISFYLIEPQSKIYSDADKIKQDAANFEIAYKAGKALTAHWQDLIKTVETGKPGEKEVRKAAALRNIKIKNISPNNAKSAHYRSSNKNGYFSRETRINALLYYIKFNINKLYTYKQDLYSWLGTSRSGYGLGKLDEAFMTHLFNLHHTLNIKNKSSVRVEENRTNNFYNLLLQAVENNRPWFTGGDYIVAVDNGTGNNVMYNFQLKSTLLNTISYNEQLTHRKLIESVSKIKNGMASKNLDEIAENIYNALKTSAYLTKMDTYTSNALNKMITSTLEKQKT